MALQNSNLIPLRLIELHTRTYGKEQVECKDFIHTCTWRPAAQQLLRCMLYWKQQRSRSSVRSAELPKQESWRPAKSVAAKLKGGAQVKNDIRSKALVHLVLCVTVSTCRTFRSYLIFTYILCFQFYPPSYGLVLIQGIVWVVTNSFHIYLHKLSGYILWVLCMRNRNRVSIWTTRAVEPEPAPRFFKEPEPEPPFKSRFGSKNRFGKESILQAEYEWN